MIIVSACLAGFPCRYNGRSWPLKEIEELVEAKKAIPLCPEELGGLSTPRPPAEIIGGSGEDVLHGRAKVITVNKHDVTLEFIKGAQEVLKIAKGVKAKRAILKAKSPSCGYGLIYDGTFSGRLRPGNGVCAALLLREGIAVEERG